MGIYADKSPKVPSKNGRKKSSSSIYYDLPIIKSQRAFKSKDDENSHNNNSYSKDSESRMKYLMEKYRSIVHYNSPEPKRYGAKAFTKNSEIYIAPGEESALPHELAHMYQQKTQNIPATDETNGEKVNTDPKLEEEADEIAKHIEDYIPRIALESINNAKTNSVMQFEDQNDKEFREIIKREAVVKGFKINSYVKMRELIDKAKEYYNSWSAYISSFFSRHLFTNYKQTCVIWALESMESELSNVAGSEECKLYSDLENSKYPPRGTFVENGAIYNRYMPYHKRINDNISAVMDMLSTEKIFEHNTGDNESPYTLHEIIPRLTENQLKKLKECILSLKDNCDAKGIKSVLNSANININTIMYATMLDKSNYTDTERAKSCFINRLNLMTEFIERVAAEKDADGKTFGEKYWIRSTGSDPHKDGEHALFLVNKRTNKIDRVYKPHDLRADAAVVGKNGIFSKINKKFEDENTLNGTIIEMENAFATMDIDVDHHTEEFITKKSEMTQSEAQKYFFRAGMLEAVANAMAIIDLHCDNIMPTKIDNAIAPAIIDAEVNFFEYEPSLLSKMNSDGALKNYTRLGKPTVSGFNITGDPNNITTNNEAFKEDIDYYNNYKEGYNFMVKEMQSHLSDFEKIYRNQLEKVIKVRIVPVSTEILAYNLQLYNMGIDNVRLAEDTKNKITNELGPDKNPKNGEKYVKEGYVFKLENHNMHVEFLDNNMKNSLIKSLENGTIPAIHIDINDSTIYLDDNKIGNICNRENNKVDKNAIIDMLVQNFSNFVIDMKLK